MLKRLFTSNTRIKLLTVFIKNAEEEYFIRQLTRKLDEQINSIRRELDNLKRAGFLKARVKNRKKYYSINKNFILLEEFRSIIQKATATDNIIAQDIEQFGKVKLLILSGQFINKPTTTVDMLIVGDLDKEKFANYLNTDQQTERPVKFTILSEEDYKYRISCKDKFLGEIIANSENQTIIKKI